MAQHNITYFFYFFKNSSTDQNSAIVIFIKMERDDTFDDIQLLKCSKHPTQPKDILCIEQSCQIDSLICCLCNYSDHKHHKSHSIKRIVKQMAKDWEDSQSNIEWAVYIDWKKSSILAICQQIPQKQKQQHVVEAVNKYFTRINLYFEGKFYHDYLKITTKLKYSKPSNNVYSNLQKLVKSYIKYASPQQSKLNQDLFLEKMQNLKKEIDQKQNTLQNLIKNKQSQESLLELICTEVSLKKFAFSQKFKHSKISITDLYTAKVDDGYDTLMVLVEPELKTKRSIKFEMVTINSWVCLGICFRSIVEGNNYVFPTTNHGTYQVSYDGYLYTCNSQNEQYNGWYYSAGDVVTLQYSPKQQVIVFTKNSDQNQLKLTFQPKPGQKVYFCASLNNPGQCIKIVP